MWNIIRKVSSTSLKAQKPKQNRGKIPAELQKDLTSLQKQQKEYTYLSKITHFDENTIRLMHYRFQCMNEFGIFSDEVTIDKFANMLDMKESNILLRQFFKFIDNNNMGYLTFRNFTQAMSMLDINADDREKIKFSFHMYDENNDGIIDYKECRNMVKFALNETNLIFDNEEIDAIVNNTYSVIDTKKKGEINYNEYEIYCLKNPKILAPFRFDIKHLLQFQREYRRDFRYNEQISERKLLKFQQTSPPMNRNKRKSLHQKLIKNIKLKFSNDSIVDGNKIERLFPLTSLISNYETNSNHSNSTKYENNPRVSISCISIDLPSSTTDIADCSCVENTESLKSSASSLYMTPGSSSEFGSSAQITPMSAYTPFVSYSYTPTPFANIKCNSYENIKYGKRSKKPKRLINNNRRIYNHRSKVNTNTMINEGVYNRFADDSYSSDSSITRYENKCKKYRTRRNSTLKSISSMKMLKNRKRAQSHHITKSSIDSALLKTVSMDVIFSNTT